MNKMNTIVARTPQSETPQPIFHKWYHRPNPPCNHSGTCSSACPDRGFPAYSRTRWAVELEMASARSPCIIPDAHHITAAFQLHLPRKSGLPSAIFLLAETSKNDFLLICIPSIRKILSRHKDFVLSDHGRWSSLSLFANSKPLRPYRFASMIGAQMGELLFYY